MGERPVIGFLTDFGLDGAAAICRGVMLGIARDAQIVDIAHGVEKYAIADGAWLLASALPWLPVGAHVAVVDPGVGTERRAIAILPSRGDVLIGPDNGLLIPAADRLGGIAGARLLDNPAWRLARTSDTFHGRDIFAPAAAHLAAGARFEDAGPVIDPGSLVRLDLPSAAVEQGRLATGVVYVDSFGNLRLAGTAGDLAAALVPRDPGPLDAGTRLALEVPAGPAVATWSRTFGEVPAGELLVYTDSSGTLAVAEALGSAARRLGLRTGARIGIRRA